ncbi:MAG TPA: hypothetical protein ENJ20_04280 [Bacteroidetes bacterium]|nr:hypothetical protein [Bacteroidota bacterium]
MKKRITFIILLLCPVAGLYAQNNDTEKQDLPYYEIGEYPAEYTDATVAARMIDGLGFRFYWATEGLRPQDLAFRPNEEARTSEETIDHIYDLSYMILNAVLQKPNSGGGEGEMTFAEKRKKTLENLKTASDILKKSGKGDLEKYKIIFKRGDRISEFPFWNLINGPIADAIWHCGQVVSFRRSSGNPFHSGVSVFSGKIRQ